MKYDVVQIKKIDQVFVIGLKKTVGYFARFSDACEYLVIVKKSIWLKRHLFD